jgi:hypothetical protein
MRCSQCNYLLPATYRHASKYQHRSSTHYSRHSLTYYSFMDDVCNALALLARSSGNTYIHGSRIINFSIYIHDFLFNLQEQEINHSSIQHNPGKQAKLRPLAGWLARWRVRPPPRPAGCDAPSAPPRGWWRPGRPESRPSPCPCPWDPPLGWRRRRRTRGRRGGRRRR